MCVQCAPLRGSLSPTGLGDIVGHVQLGVRAPGLAVVQNFGSKPKVVKFQGDVSDTAAVEAFLDEASRKVGVSPFVSVALRQAIASTSLPRVLQFPEDESVLVLNDKNFNAAIDEYGSVLVEFYAPVRCPSRALSGMRRSPHGVGD